ncbi:uncharacterized protein LOC108734196 isoform X2 [Agrilus planipennis]|uniref:Uncharacterized protein LOC108734196 isoform X2 n=1 Tax=Agrilus planipennis TaxID=224129 RepID=A0A1W4WAV6_AGRPL|nr:uncharacterized protein LOC108734196 isoform X2 [Agrilus planipennis]
MILLAAIAILQSAVTAGSMPAGPGIPENITVTFLTPTSVRVSWATTVDNVDKYDVTYKPTGARVVAVVAGNSDALTLTGLKADTQYHLTVSAIWAGKRYRSRPIVFRTLEQSRYSAQHDIMTTHGTGIPPTKDISDVEDLADYPQTNFTVRGVEIGIVLLVLVVWVAAIALFFNRWGKIRMLLPYQPDFKEQLKVPGTVACAAAVAAGNTCNHTTELVCSQSRWPTGSIDREPRGLSRTRRQRDRTNSAIFISNSGPGFDSKEFMRRYGSISRLCRKARSVDNISLDESKKHFGLPTLSISGPSPPVEDIDDPEELQKFI